MSNEPSIPVSRLREAAKGYRENARWTYVDGHLTSARGGAAIALEELADEAERNHQPVPAFSLEYSVMETLDRRFTSGNNTPVSQARITREEYEALRRYIEQCQSVPEGWQDRVAEAQSAIQNAAEKGALIPARSVSQWLRYVADPKPEDTSNDE